MNFISPIALFVFNRPEHTKRTIDALKKNFLAEQSELIIFSDGPRAEKDEENVKKVRDYLKCVDGFKKISVIHREENFGLARSIIEGVTETLESYGSVIVLEDDIVTSPYFLQYMNDALNKYRGVEKVMHVSGYMYPIAVEDLPETFFYRATSSWGWGTWSRAWALFRKEPRQLVRQFTHEELERFDLGGVADHWTQAIQNARGRIDTWSVYWYASVFKNKGLCLYPAVSMTINIGHDSTGIHSKDEKFYNVRLASMPVKEFNEDFSEELKVVSRMTVFYKENYGRNINMLASRFFNYWFYRFFFG